MTYIPDTINKLNNLIVLNINNNIIHNLPSICNLIHLQQLNLSYNKLLYLPKEIKSLYKLIFLGLQNNKFYEIDKNIPYINLYNIKIDASSYNKNINFKNKLIFISTFDLRNNIRFTQCKQDDYNKYFFHGIAKSNFYIKIPYNCRITVL